MSEKKDGGHVAAKIAAVMGELGEMAQDGTNPHFKYSYTSIQEVMRTLRPLMAAHNLVVIPSVVGATRDDRDRVSTDLQMQIIDSDTGDVALATWRGEGQDKQDKGTAKSARSGYKYFLLSLFLVSAGDEEDTDGSGPQKVSDKQRATKNQKPKSRPTGKEPMEPEPFRAKMQKDSNYPARTGPKAKPIGEDTRKNLVAILSKGVDFDKATADDRKSDSLLVIGWVFPGVDGVEQLTESEGTALIGAWYDKASVLNEYAKAEIGSILAEARDDEQMPF